MFTMIERNLQNIKNTSKIEVHLTVIFAKFPSLHIKRIDIKKRIFAILNLCTLFHTEQLSQSLHTICRLAHRCSLSLGQFIIFVSVFQLIISKNFCFIVNFES